MKSKLVVFMLLFASGFLLATLGVISLPVVHNINFFWPAATVQAVGAVLFGWTGVLAGTLFPILSNFVTDSTLVAVYCFTPANFLQSYLAYFVYGKLVNPRINISTTRDAISFVLAAGLLPQFVGGISSAGMLVATGRVSGWGEIAAIVGTWVLDSVPWIAVFGIPIVAIFAPMLRESGLLWSVHGVATRSTCRS